MNLALAAAAFCALVFAGVFFAWPWLEPKTMRRFAGSGSVFEKYRELHQEREALLESLTDLETDFQMGKLSSEDKDLLRKSLAEKLMDIIRQIESLEKTHPLFIAIEEDLKAIEDKAS